MYGSMEEEDEQFPFIAHLEK